MAPRNPPTINTFLLHSHSFHTLHYHSNTYSYTHQYAELHDLWHRPWQIFEAVVPMRIRTNLLPNLEDAFTILECICLQRTTVLF